MSYYILREHEAIPVDGVTWARWLETAQQQRIVAKTNIAPDVTISTVFLGLDHQWGEGPPLIFETLVFGGKHDGEMQRYSTWHDAEVGHLAMVVELLNVERI